MKELEKPRFLVFGYRSNGKFQGLLWVVDTVIRSNTVDCLLIETDEQGISETFFRDYQNSRFSLNYTFNRHLFSGETKYICYNIDFRELDKFVGKEGYWTMSSFVSLLSNYKTLTYGEFIYEYQLRGIKKKYLLDMAVVLSRYNVYR